MSSLSGRDREPLVEDILRIVLLLDRLKAWVVRSKKRCSPIVVQSAVGLRVAEIAVERRGDILEVHEHVFGDLASLGCEFVAGPGENQENITGLDFTNFNSIVSYT